MKRLFVCRRCHHVPFGTVKESSELGKRFIFECPVCDRRATGATYDEAATTWNGGEEPPVPPKECKYKYQHVPMQRRKKK